MCGHMYVCKYFFNFLKIILFPFSNYLNTQILQNRVDQIFRFFLPKIHFQNVCGAPHHDEEQVASIQLTVFSSTLHYKNASLKHLI